MKRFLMLLATSYVPGLLIMLTSGGDDKALVIAAISIVFVPCFTAWAVIVMFCARRWFCVHVIACIILLVIWRVETLLKNQKERDRSAP